MISQTKSYATVMAALHHQDTSLWKLKMSKVKSVSGEKINCLAQGCAILPPNTDYQKWNKPNRPTHKYYIFYNFLNKSH